MRRLLPIVVLAACGGGDELADVAPPVVGEPPADALAKVTEHGPVKATVQVWPAKPTLGEPIYARLSIEAPHGVDIEAPFQEAGDQRLGRFRVVGFTRDTRPSGAGQRHQQTYTLEAQASGKHRVPPLRFEVLDAREPTPYHRPGGGSAGEPNPAPGDQPAALQEVLTDEVPLDVAPVPTETASAPLRGALGPLDATIGGTSALAVLGVLSLLAIAASGGILAVRGVRSRRRIAQQRTAYDEAMQSLGELLARGAPDAEGADGWFVELSAIVRRYLEQRYDIRAPELTTEEFLLVATARPELREEHRDLLSSFLERCDRVKFAGYRPDADESLATLAAARGFVEDTRLREVAA